ncbi:hypothetical protein GE061_006571 [Apolygus lucorum]|uniref:Uncharacterized protein n=1 Tax=Apolygus lucorum TaxID=248454 RepID=A0A6A4J5J5_APOLU|nr:hypothetical protein GE061_006571 [Apolygus lucorum]
MVHRFTKRVVHGLFETAVAEWKCQWSDQLYHPRNHHVYASTAQQLPLLRIFRSVCGVSSQENRLERLAHLIPPR